MALKQPASASVYTEPKGSGTATPITPLALCADARGGYEIRALAQGELPAARLLADARSGYTVSAGSTNPGGLAEMRFIDVGGNGNVSTYE